MLAITCPVCQTKISLQKVLADKKVECPACGQLTPVPGAAQPAHMGDWVLTPLPDSSGNVEAPSPAPAAKDPPTHPPPGSAGRSNRPGALEAFLRTGG